MTLLEQILYDVIHDYVSEILVVVSFSIDGITDGLSVGL